MKLTPHDPQYPRSLFRLDMPPILSVSGPLVMTQRIVAVVGARSATRQARQFSFALAYHLARANVTVVSGGAVGIDRMAHLGAMHAGGTTWLVSPTGRGEIYPPQNAALFTQIEQSHSSRLIWPFPDGTVKDVRTPRFRNAVLVALAECVVVIQARLGSGSRNAATWGRHLRRPVFFVPSTPWDKKYGGSIVEVMGGGLPLWSIEWFFDRLDLPPPDMKDPNAAWRGVMPPSAPVPRRQARPQTYSEPSLFPMDPSTWSQEEKVVFSNISMTPTQQDTIVTLVGLPTSSTLTALLTLSLKDVVVEGPDGFFRRRVAL